MDARTAYAALTNLEKRMAGDRFEDIAEGQFAVTWPFLLNEYVVPRLVRSGRITPAEGRLLDSIRRREPIRAEEGEDGVSVWPDVHEYLLSIYPVHGIQAGQLAFRGHADAEWSLLPTLFRGEPDEAEIEGRLERTFGFVAALARASPEMGAKAEGNTDEFLELVAVAQHYGFPTHLVDFTSDLRTAAFFATRGARKGGTGELIVLHLAQYEQLGGHEGGIFGSLVRRSAPNPRIERQSGLFLAGHQSLLFGDRRTDIVERYRFRQNGEPLAPDGGYDEPALLAPDTDDPLLALAAASAPLAAGAVKPPALAAHCGRYLEFARKAAATAFRELGDREYALACAWALKGRLRDDSPWIDRKIASFLVGVQCDLHDAGLGPFFESVHVASVAFDQYLKRNGTLEERVAAAMHSYLSRTADPDKEGVVESIIDRHIVRLERDLAQPDDGVNEN